MGSSDFQFSFRLYSLWKSTSPGLLPGATLVFFLYVRHVEETVEFLNGEKKKAVMRDLDQLSAIQQISDEFAVWIYTTKYTSSNKYYCF